MSTIGDSDLLAIMAAFKSLDTDGDNSIGRIDLSNILYHISNNQSLSEIDQEVDSIMDLCDNDKSGAISYVEFFSTLKRRDLSPKVKAALNKLTSFMVLKEDDKKKLIKENESHFTQLVHDKEEIQQKNHVVDELKESLNARVLELENSLKQANEQIRVQESQNNSQAHDNNNRQEQIRSIEQLHTQTQKLNLYNESLNQENLALKRELRIEKDWSGSLKRENDDLKLILSDDTNRFKTEELRLSGALRNTEMMAADLRKNAEKLQAANHAVLSESEAMLQEVNTRCEVTSEECRILQLELGDLQNTVRELAIRNLVDESKTADHGASRALPTVPWFIACILFGAVIYRSIRP